jgi:hypothetical protein
MTRSPQTGTANNNQDVLTSGSASRSYSNPVASTVGSTNPSTLVLDAGRPYTDVLSIRLAGAHVLAITNSLYAGADTNGVLLAQVGGMASGSTYLTNAFDALAIGWRVQTNLWVSLIDINRISVSSTLTRPPLIPSLDFQLVGDQLRLSWPAPSLGWTLQIQTNQLSRGLGSNWVNVPGSTATNLVFIPLVPGNDSVFLRLACCGQ